MLKNKEYKRFYRNLIRPSATKRRENTLWLDRRSERHIQIMAALFFIGFGLTIAYGFKTLLSWSQISQIYFAGAVVFSFIPRRWLPVIYRIRKEMKILLGICALAPFFTGLLLILNFYIGNEYSQQTLKVLSYQVELSDKMITIDLENSELNKHIEIRKFSVDTFYFEPDSAVYVIHRGFLGIKTVNDSWLLPKN